MSAFLKSQKKEAYQIYVTDALRAIAGSTGARYYDLIHDTEPEQTPEEVKEEILEKFRR